MSEAYGALFRDAYALLHGGRPGEFDSVRERRAGEAVEDYLAHTRDEALSIIRTQLMSADPPEALAEAHRLILALLSNAMQADEALADQVRAYQCGQFNESVGHSDHLQEMVVESQRMDRDLITTLRNLPASVREKLEIEL